MLLLGYGAAVYNNIRPLYGQELVQQRWRTYISAGNTIAMAVGGAFISSYGGSLIQANGYKPFYSLCAGIALVSGLIILVYPRLAALLARPKSIAAAESK